MMTLRIHATDAPRLGTGHAWVELNRGDGTTETFGLWRDDPDGGPGGLLTNRERAREMTGTAGRETVLDAARLAAIDAIVARDAALGPDAWREIDGPAPFTCELWMIAAGEVLDCRAYGSVGSVSHLHAALSGEAPPPAPPRPAFDRMLSSPVIDIRDPAPP